MFELDRLDLFEKTIVMYEVGTFEYMRLQRSVEKTNNNNLIPGLKLSYLVVFWVESEKKYFQICKHHPRILQNAKSHVKQKKEVWS